MGLEANISESVNLTCQAQGTPPIHYQWLRDGVLIDGAVFPYLYIPELRPEDRGSYVCEAVNPVDTTQSEPGTIVISGRF